MGIGDAAAVGFRLRGAYEGYDSMGVSVQVSEILVCDFIRGITRYRFGEHHKGGWKITPVLLWRWIGSGRSPVVMPLDDNIGEPLP